MTDCDYNADIKGLQSAKSELFECITKKHGVGSWSKYWNSYRDYIMGDLTKCELDAVVNSLLEEKDSKPTLFGNVSVREH